MEQALLGTAGKHFNNTRAVARQLLGKWDPAATDMHSTVEVLLNYNNRNVVSYVVVPKCYKQGQSSSGLRVISVSVE
jgi:hypothetical protein